MFTHLPEPRGFLLTMGSYQGTLAAARDLGRHGIPVILVDSQRHTLTSVSRYISGFYEAPGLDQFDEFVQWLLDFGQKNPGYVLYPTSDDMCWMVASKQNELSKFFYLFQPSEQSTYQILNKGELFRCCQALGVDSPETWIPSTDEERQQLADTLEYPVLIKPKTQAGMIVNMKGALCRSRNELLAAFETLKNRFPYRQDLLDYDPDLVNVMVQKFYPEAAEHIYSLAGFFDAKNDIYVLRASEKTLQIPLKIGVGLCFESREIYEEPANQLRKILEHVGYNGAFEAEFIHVAQDNRFLLIDLNSRFYGQMSFEIARNLPISRLCYYAAIGDDAKVRELGQAAADWNHSALHKHRILCMLRFLVFTKWISGHMSRNRRRFWLEWSMGGSCYDPIYDPADPKPLWAYIWDRILGFIKYPRSGFRMYF